MVKLFFIFFLLYGCKEIPAKDSPPIIRTPLHITIAPGEVKLLQYPITQLSKAILICDQAEVPHAFQEKQLVAYLVESYFSHKKSYQCYLKTSSEKGKEREELLANINIVKKKYPVEYLKVNHKKVDLSVKNLKRVENEKKFLEVIYQSSSPQLYFQGNFKAPLESKKTSYYGIQRIFNKKFNTEHLGIDFRAQIGTPIPSAHRGKVVLVQDLFFSGNTVIIDHGLGLFTMYGHLSKLKVKQDQIVEQGEIIGLSGMTGRVTGPHLHWGVKALGHWVDGSSLLNLFP